MKCLNCGTEIKENKIRIPRKCNVCGMKFEMVLNTGVLIYLFFSLISILCILYILKQIFNNEWILYILLALEIAIIPNKIEKFLAKIHIVKYKNLK